MGPLLLYACLSLAQDPDPSAVDLAVRKAIAYLKSNNAAHLLMADHVGRKTSKRELVLYTYVMWGMDETEPEFKALLDDMLKDLMTATYCVALQAMALEEIDRLKHRLRIWKCAKFLVDCQGPAGSWGYGSPSLYMEDLPADRPGPRDGALESTGQPGLKSKPVVKTRLAMRKDRDAENGDLSNSYFAALGLRAAHDAGIALPPAVVDRAMKYLRETQKQARVAAEPFVETPAPPKPRLVAPQGWCYNQHAEHRAYGSMTAAGLSSLMIWDYIKDNDGGKKKTWKKDPDVLEGLQWLAKNFSVTFNPGPYEHAQQNEDSQHQYLYYLHALSGVGLMYGTEALGTRSWYGEGAKALLASQSQNGSWGSGTADTCFAILFLKRGTRWLSPP